MLRFTINCSASSLKDTEASSQPSLSFLIHGRGAATLGRNCPAADRYAYVRKSGCKHGSGAVCARRGSPEVASHETGRPSYNALPRNERFRDSNDVRLSSDKEQRTPNVQNGWKLQKPTSASTPDYYDSGGFVRARISSPGRLLCRASQCCFLNCERQRRC